MNKTNLLVGAYYCEENTFAQIDEIFKYISETGDIIKEGLNELQINYLNLEIAKFEKSFNSLEKSKKIKTKEDFYKIFDNMIECFYSEFNLSNCEKPKITIVEKFPHPFEDKNYKAMTFSALHEKKFGVPKGIYLLEKYTVHGISEIMIAHEIMHYVLNNLTKPEELLNQEPFLSEGIVDFTSQYLLLKYNIIDTVCLKNWIEFGRANCTDDYIGSLYFREAKQILLIAKKRGMAEIKKLINFGMKELASLNMKEYYYGTCEAYEDKVLNRLISIYDTALTEFSLTVEEFNLFNQLLASFNGVEIEKISLDLMEKEEKLKNLKSLQQKGLLYILDNKVFNTNISLLRTIKVRLF